MAEPKRARRVPLRHGLVDRVFGGGDAVDTFLPDRVLFQLRRAERPQFGGHHELHDRMQLRQHRLADRAVAAQDEHRAERLDRLLVPLLAGHGPDLAIVAAAVDDKETVGAEADPRLAQGRGDGKARREDQEQGGTKAFAHGRRC